MPLNPLDARIRDARYLDDITARTAYRLPTPKPYWWEYSHHHIRTATSIRFRHPHLDYH
jgi:hypothetical protein